MWAVHGGCRGIAGRALRRCWPRCRRRVGGSMRSWSGSMSGRSSVSSSSTWRRCFHRYGVQIWLPEAGGAVDVGSPEHKALMTVLGAQSRREVLRSRHRVLAAMEAQAREQGRYLGGRPPYGYRLVDAGPHPNRAHAGRSEHSGGEVARRSNPADAWAISTVVAHPPLVSEAEFVAAQRVRAARPPVTEGARRVPTCASTSCSLSSSSSGRSRAGMMSTTETRSTFRADRPRSSPPSRPRPW